MTRTVLVALAIGLVSPVASAAPAPPRPATFALIIGVNRSVDRDAETLRYADDDAAQYFELFRSLGARTYLLTQLDPEDRALYPQAAAEATPPTKKSLDDAVTRLTADLAAARRAGVATELYVVYAGHGNVDDEGGYVALSDARLSGTAIARDVIDRANASRTHLIVDACDSYLLTLGRGPGGQRRSLHGFATLRGNFDDTRVGLLLSTSSARASHEWSGFSSGVFSYELRAGLQGAADADGDGFVSYREIAAFVGRANAAIVNPAYRPEVFARPPRGEQTLLDIRQPTAEHIGVDGEHPGHYIVEDNRGVRIAEFHNPPHQAVQLVRRHDVGAMYLRQVETSTGSSASASSRGAADDLFGSLFRMPFDRAAVEDYQFPVAREPEVVDRPAHDDRVRHLFGWSTLGVATLAAAGGAWAAWSAHSIAGDITPSTVQRIVVEQNERIDARNQLAIGLGIGAAAAAITGSLLLLWPDHDRQVIVVPSLDGLGAAMSTKF